MKWIRTILITARIFPKRRMNNMFSLYKKELRSYYCSPFAYIIAALFLLVFSLSFINGISNLSGHQFKFSFPNVFYNNFFYFILLIPMLTMRTFADLKRNRSSADDQSFKCFPDCNCQIFSCFNRISYDACAYTVLSPHYCSYRRSNLV